MHSHASPRHAAPEPRRRRRVAWLVLAPLAATVALAMTLLWPTGGLPEQGATSADEELQGRVTAVQSVACAGGPATGEGAATADEDCREASVELEGGGAGVTVPVPTGAGAPEVEAGDDVVVTRGATPDGVVYAIVDQQRGTGMWVLVGAFVLALVAFGRWRGVSSLVGLAVTFGVLGGFVVPAVLAGESPLLVAVVGSAAVIVVVLPLTHGVSLTTVAAVVGTLLSFVVTGLVGALSVSALHLSGITDDVAMSVATRFDVQMSGLLLAGIVIGAVGVLDDVTVTQASTVAELARADPGATARQLFAGGQRVGRAHVASVVNTIVLAYAGSSLPLIVLTLADTASLGGVVTDQFVAQEVVRSIVGTLGLIAAVPITTALAAVLLRGTVRAEEAPPAGSA
jgi:uncharacterized membrane protein